MVKDFSERESERAAQDAEFAKAVTEWDQRTKAHASEVEQKIAKYIKQREIHGVKLGIDQSNNRIILERSTGTLEISFREVGDRLLMSQEWKYSVNQKRTGGSGTRPSLEHTADNLGLNQMTEDQMEDAVTDWLKQT
jgi:hypothetical protein